MTSSVPKIQESWCDAWLVGRINHLTRLSGKVGRIACSCLVGRVMSCVMQSVAYHATLLRWAFLDWMPRIETVWIKLCLRNMQQMFWLWTWLKIMNNKLKTAAHRQAHTSCNFLWPNDHDRRQCEPKRLEASLAKMGPLTLRTLTSWRAWFSLRVLCFDRC